MAHRSATRHHVATTLLMILVSLTTVGAVAPGSSEGGEWLVDSASETRTQPAKEAR